MTYNIRQHKHPGDKLHWSWRTNNLWVLAHTYHVLFKYLGCMADWTEACAEPANGGSQVIKKGHVLLLGTLQLLTSRGTEDSPCFLCIGKLYLCSIMAIHRKEHNADLEIVVFVRVLSGVCVCVCVCVCVHSLWICCNTLEHFGSWFSMLEGNHLGHACSPNLLFLLTLFLLLSSSRPLFPPYCFKLLLLHSLRETPRGASSSTRGSSVKRSGIPLRVILCVLFPFSKPS